MKYAAPHYSQYSPRAHAFRPPITRTLAPRYTQYSPRLLAVVHVFLNKMGDLCTPESFRIQNPLESTPALRLGGCRKLKITNVIAYIFPHRCSSNTSPTASGAAQCAAYLWTAKAFGFGWESIGFSAQSRWQRVFPTRQWSGPFSRIHFGLQRFTARLELAGNAPLPIGAPMRFNRAKRVPVIGAATVIERCDARLLLANGQFIKVGDALVVR